jgi:hypothetical protein
MLDSIRNIDPSSHKDIETLRDIVKLLLNTVEQQWDQIEKLRQENQELKDEINRLKGEQSKPKFPKSKPGPPKDISSEKRRRKKNHKKGKKKPNIPIDRTKYCRVDKTILPADAQHKGYAEVIQQELRLVRSNTLYKVELYYSPSQGKVYRGQLPKEYLGEFGGGLRSLIQALHHVCDVTHGRLDAFLKSQGILMSSGTISNTLLSSEDWACEEQREILRAGIENSPYTQADSTKSKEKGEGKATQIIGAEFFTVFYTMDSKSRLDVVCALLGKPAEGLSLCLNNASRVLLGHFGIAQKDRCFLEEHFGNGQTWTIAAFGSYMEEHAPKIRAKKNMYPRILESLALGHYHEQEDFPVVEFLLSDDAGEYKKIARWSQALCWIHDARYYNKLTPKIEIHRSIKEDFQKRYWQFYYQLLDFKELPAAQQKVQKTILEQQFDKLFKPDTGYFQLNECILRTLGNKAKLLTVLDNPALPLHNNAAELGARRVVRKRDISLHSWSERGTRVRDAFMSIVETAAKLGVNAMDYIHDRITKKYEIPHLASLVQQAYS